MTIRDLINSGKISLDTVDTPRTVVQRSIEAARSPGTWTRLTRWEFQCRSWVWHCAQSIEAAERAAKEKKP